MPLIASLTKAYSENRIEERLKFYCHPKLLIIDEIGYIPIDRHGAHLFFQLVSTTINIKGNSYRLREKVKAGLIREPDVEESKTCEAGSFFDAYKGPKLDAC
jgi:hypothetical protein